MKQSARFKPVKRMALDGKTWWVVWDMLEHKYSTLLCFGKYQRKKDAQLDIEYYIAAWNLEVQA